MWARSRLRYYLQFSMRYMYAALHLVGEGLDVVDRQSPAGLACMLNPDRGKRGEGQGEGGRGRPRTSSRHKEQRSGISHIPCRQAANAVPNQSVSHMVGRHEGV